MKCNVNFMKCKMILTEYCYVILSLISPVGQLCFKSFPIISCTFNICICGTVRLQLHLLACAKQYEYFNYNTMN